MNLSFYTFHVRPLPPLSLTPDALAEIGALAWNQVDVALPALLKARAAAYSNATEDWAEPWLDLCEDDVGITESASGALTYGIALCSPRENISEPIPVELLRKAVMMVVSEFSTAAVKQGHAGAAFEVSRVSRHRTLALPARETAADVGLIANQPQDEALWVAVTSYAVQQVFTSRSEAFASGAERLTACSREGQPVRDYVRLAHVAGLAPTYALQA